MEKGSKVQSILKSIKSLFLQYSKQPKKPFNFFKGKAGAFTNKIFFNTFS
jgi:hypothetical protein